MYSYIQLALPLARKHPVIMEKPAGHPELIADSRLNL